MSAGVNGAPWTRDSDREGRLMSFLEDGTADALDELHAVLRGKAGDRHRLGV